jgi:euchromatic histone-lysine N-methyltransferase
MIPSVCIVDVLLYKMKLIVVSFHGLPHAEIDYLHGSMSSNEKPISTSCWEYQAIKYTLV